MAYDPKLGYDPNAVFDPTTGQFVSQTGASPQTQQQWIADAAAQLTFDFANGLNPTSQLWYATLWQQAGIPTPPEGTFGSLANNPNNALSPAVYNAMQQFATYLYNNPQAAAGGGLPAGAGSLPSVPVITPDQAGQLFAGQQNALDRAQQAALQTQADAAAAARNAASIQGQLQSAQIGAAAQTASAQISAEASKYAADVRASVDREAIASGERIAGADRLSRETISALDRAESGRQFDLRLGEDRRQFNATMVFNLFDRAVELSRRPVDWLAHQYFMENLGIPLSFLNLQATAGMFGAIPPSGPSQAGPLRGGPGVLDGEMQLAQRAGVPADQVGTVPVSQAVAEYPGTHETANAAATLGNIQTELGIDPAALDRQVAEAQVETLGDLTDDPQNPVVQRAIATAEQIIASPPAPLTAATAPGETLPAIPTAAGTGAVSTLPVEAPGGTVAPPPPIPGAATAGAVTTQPSAPENRGVFTGDVGTQQATANAAQSVPFTTLSGVVQPSSQPSTAGQANPQGELLLQQLATQLGMPAEELRKIMPVQLLAGGYSKEAILNSPVIQALMQGKQTLSAFRTAPTEGTPFGTLSGFGGINLGIRGGQDINQQLFTKSNPSTVDQLQGAIEAAGLYFPDVVAQSRRTSPFTDLPVGSVGTRRF